MKPRIIVSGIVALATAFGLTLHAEQLSADVIKKASESLRATMPRCMSIGVPKVTSIDADHAKKTLAVNCNWAYSNVPFTAADIEQLKRNVLEIAGRQYAGYEVTVAIDGSDVANYLPQYDSRHARHHAPFVQVDEASRRYSAGLDGNIIALWQSHGWYFEPELNRWEWQRARVWQTVEDL